MEKKKEDFEVKVKKQGKNVEVEVDTKNVDVRFDKTETEKHFQIHGKNLTVEVDKTPEGTNVHVDAEKGFLQKVGAFIAKIVTRKFRK
jgi:NAD-dependent SIR2 family protein deacetylase